MPAVDKDLSGSRFGGYDLLELIGRGGMGLVYRARQRNLDREVALKVLAPKLAANRKFIQRFVREARAAGRLSHPNVVQGYDVGEIDGRYFFAMELVRGETLLERLRRAGPIDEALAVQVIRKVADALGHASGHGITHRDIKPDNILWSADGEPKLADLGLAKVERRSDDADPDRPQSDVESHGSDNMVMGTAGYISPEQVMAKRGVDVRSDFYALGMSIFHLLTGELPFPRRSRTEMLAAHCEDPLPDVRARAPKVSAGLAALLQKLGEKDPDDRPQTAEEIGEALDAIASGAPMPWETAEGQARRLRQIARRRRQRAVSQGGVALAVVVCIAAAGAFAFRGGATDDPARKRSRRPTRPKPTPSAAPDPAPAPDPTPDPDPTPAPPPPDRTAITTAEAWVAAHPEDRAGAVAQWEAAVAASEGVARDEAERALAEAKRALAKALATAHRAAAAEVRELIAAERLAEAARKLAALPEAWRAGDEGLALQQRLDEAAEGAFESVRQAVDSAQRDQDWSGALAALRPVLDWGVPVVVDRARTLIGTLEQLAADWERLKDGSRQTAALRRAGVDVNRHLAARDVSAAAATLSALSITAPRPTELLADERAAVQDAAACVAAVAGSKRLLKGQPFALGNVQAEIVRIEDDTLVLKLRSGGLERKLAELDAPAWLALARLALDAGATPGEGVAGNAHAGWVVIALAAGDAAAAQSAFEAGDWELDVHYRLQGRLELAPKLGREIEAFGLLDEAEAAIAAKNGTRAAELLEQLEFDYADTDASRNGQVRRRDVRRAADRLAMGPGPPHQPGKGGHELPGGD